MAQFKILLMTPSVKLKKEKDLFFTNFLYSTISEFYSDIKIENTPNQQNFSFSKQKVSHCYTYNEKISIHTNSQKDFSFSMLRNLWQNDERIVNPFVPIIHAGTQILLIDQFDNHLVFTVKSISYELKEENIVYNYSCQDSFTYQTIRQNAGYFISNDVMSEDFIGAKTIDWWISKKIKPECHIGYEYLYMQQGLWQDNLGNIHTFDFLDEIKETLPTLGTGVYCQKILKQPWNTTDHSDFFEPISFSADGSNASQVLIDLGGKLGLNLRTFERCFEDGSFKGYFWFEQSKNEENNGLIYSPYSNIQSFGFSHEASSLTTVLNIQPNNVGEELITLLPEVPPFFLNLFHSKNWENTTYTTGWFSSFCTSQIFIITENSTDYKIDLTLSDEDSTKGGWEIKDNTCEIKLPLFSREENVDGQINRFFKVPEHYPYCSFLSSDGKPSTIIVLDDLFSNLNSTWQLVKIEEGEEKPLPENLENYKNQEIPDVYLKLIFDKSSLPDASKFLITNPKIYLHFFRDCTEDEINFATAADKCPWLENKLIDFSYFLNHNIINLEEYKILLDTIKNDLRIVNGQIIYYNTSYQAALKEKTETLSNLLSQLETLNATAFAELTDKYAREGKINNIEYFDRVYIGVQQALNKYTGTSILDREDLMTEYANNYFKAQQSFLKNMYNFYDYFNSPVEEKDENAAITEYILEVCGENNNYITFSEPSFQLMTSDSFKNMYDETTGNTKELIYASDLVTKITPVSLNKINDFYIPQNKAGIIKIEPENASFSREKTYYRRTIRISPIEPIASTEDGKIEVVPHKKTYFTYNGINFKFLSRDESYWYYVTELPTQSLSKEQQETLNSTEEIVQIDNIILSDGTKTYEASGELFSQIVFFEDLINDYLLMLTRSSSMNYKVRKSMDYVQFSQFPSDSKVEKIMSAISPIFMSKILQPGNTSKYEKFTKEYEKRSKNESKMYDSYSEKEKADLVNLYWENIPLSSLWYKGPKYCPSSFTYSVGGVEYELDSQRVNKNGQTLSEYLDYLIAVKEDKTVQPIENPLAYSDYQEVAFVTTRNEYNYYRNILDSANNWWGAALVAVPIQYGWLALAAMWEWWGTSNPATSGRNNRAWDKSDIDWGKLYDYKEGYWDWSDANVEDNDNKDDVKETKEIRPVYFTHPQSYEIYLKYKTSNDLFFGSSNTDIKLTEDKSKAKFIYKDKYFTIKDSGGFGYQNKKYYHNYYSQIAYTPHLAKQDSNIYYQTSKFIMQQLDAKISIEDKYYILPLINPEGKRFFRNGRDLESCATVWYSLFSDNMEFDRVQYHPISSPAQEITFSALPYKEESYTLRDALSVLGYNNFTTLDKPTSYMTTFIQATIAIEDVEKTVTFVVFKEKNYEYVGPWGGKTNLGRNEYYTGDSFYKDASSEEEVDFSLITGLTTGFYSSWNTDSNAKKATEYISNETYYQDEELTHRAYTVPQLINAKKYYFINSQKITITTMSSVEQVFKQKLYLHSSKENSARESNLTDSFCDIGWNEVFNNIENKKEKANWPQLEYTYKGIKYNTKYWITKNIKYRLSGITKGEFWFNHHTNTMFPTIQQEAKVIETQLTDYWYNAYLNSKFCEYFLPESWKTEVNTSANYFSNNIINTYKKEDDNTTYIHLLNTYIPKVQIYKEQGKTLLPYYTIRKRKKQLDEIDSPYLIDFNSEFSLNSLSNNTAIKNSYKEILGEQLNNWVYTENTAKTSYYYSTSGGTKWSKFLSNMGVGLNNYPLLEGLYVTMFKILRDNFTTNSFDEYNKLKLKQQAIWNQLYSDFPGILLENTYSNEDATTAEELYKLSYFYFKDISQPERGYNITMINQAEIQGFEGQELKIGDSIKINISEYYDEYDDIQKSLSQLLFITDISYSLRSDADLQLTVNNIKYQDKLIRRLVKLIK